MEEEIIIKNFNPRNKEFKFNFTKDTCDNLLTGVCPIEKDIYLLPDMVYDYHNDRIMHPKCHGIYLGMRDQIITGKPFVIKCGCGHYVCNDGQHRICVAQKTGLTLDVDYIEQDSVCDDCVPKNSESSNEPVIVDFSEFFKDTKS